LSPYRDGERGALIQDFANHSRCRKGVGVAASPLLPVTIESLYGSRCRQADEGQRKHARVILAAMRQCSSR
ncbi:MAG: hypothetical protein E5X55_38905, partial [Mesorhizobium sp.]